MLPWPGTTLLASFGALLCFVCTGCPSSKPPKPTEAQPFHTERIRSTAGGFEVTFPPGQLPNFTIKREQTAAGPAVIRRYSADAYVALSISFLNVNSRAPEVAQAVLDSARDHALIELNGIQSYEERESLGPYPRRRIYFSPNPRSDVYGRLDLIFTGSRMVQLFFLSVKEAEVHSEAPAVFFDSLTILAEE